MNKSTKICIWIVALALIIWGISSLKSKTLPASSNSQPIKIGAVLGLTGYAAEDSQNVKKGIDLAVADLAKNGIKVEINYQDDKTDPKQTVSATQYLISVYKPQVIIGPIWSFLEDAATPILTQNKVISYAPANTSEFTTGGPYVFHGAVKNEKIAPVATQWLLDKKAKRVAVIVSKDGWGTSVSKAFREAAKEAGVEIVVDDAIVTGDSAVSVMSTDIAKAKSLKADAIMYTGYDEENVILAKRRSELNFKVPTLVHTQEYPKLLANKAVSENQLRGIDVISVQMSPEFLAKFKDVYRQDPGNFSDRAYDGIMMLVQAIRHNPAQTADEMANYIRNDLNYQGYAALYNFDEKGDLAGGSWTIKPAVTASVTD